MIRLPIEPLERWFAVAHPPADHKVAEQEAITGRPTANRLGEACGVHYKSVLRWRNDGIPYWSADAAATALGWHPTALWDNWSTLDPGVPRKRWALRVWWLDRRHAAVEESWRLRLDCVGYAGDLARLMFNEEGAA